VFDAKVSKAQNLQSYVDDQVKKTADKMKRSDKIYPHIFLVVPTEAISELKKIIYAKDQYTFYVVSREALSPILASLKRITTYELAETLDPQKRENIINTLAELVTQINMTSATSLITTKRGVEVISRMQQTDPELASEVDQKTKEKMISAYSSVEIKRLASSITAQNAEISSLGSPKPKITKKTIEAAESIVSQKLL
jgi:dihydroxyacetone kinase-like predicted kinase